MSAREQVDLWQSLFAHAGWKELVEIIQQQIHAREQIILKEPLSPDGVLERENLRGERNGLELVLVTAETLFETAKQELGDEKE